MTLQKIFNSTTVYEARQAAAFKKHFELEIKKIPYTPGCAGDYEIAERSEKYNELFSNSIIEFKSDKKSRKTKHWSQNPRVFLSQKLRFLKQNSFHCRMWSELCITG